MQTASTRKESRPTLPNIFLIRKEYLSKTIAALKTCLFLFFVKQNAIMFFAFVVSLHISTVLSVRCVMLQYCACSGPNQRVPCRVSGCQLLRCLPPLQCVWIKIGSFDSKELLLWINTSFWIWSIIFWLILALLVYLRPSFHFRFLHFCLASLLLQ